MNGTESISYRGTSKRDCCELMEEQVVDMSTTGPSSSWFINFLSLHSHDVISIDITEVSTQHDFRFK